ncbi:DUF4142 domain-containing protein [Sphingomonas glacialis]|uniref:DUF4142 domain-containing protein n=1 Tax=Sphingomonas glacialis TaxID=658225 RepID=A0A502FX67_9SPHN|nr:DUF4142 domain-containing protein [Sphingomonas glacialis]TPG54074.1 DUF4142 domain-containing protein [Sphingomonas glacialis]
MSKDPALRTPARLLALALGVCVLSPAIAQETGSRQTRDFVQSLAQSDTFEILAAQSALAQSSDRDVRGFAQMMITDHTAMDRLLSDSAAKAGLAPPVKAIGADQALLLNGLGGLTGPEFDKTYLQQQALAHRSALAEAQTYAASGDNAVMRSVAKTAAQAISAHVAMVEPVLGKAAAR